MEKGKATHSSILAWKIPQTEEPDGLQSVNKVAKSGTWLSTAQHVVGTVTIPVSRVRRQETKGHRDKIAHWGSGAYRRQHLNTGSVLPAPSHLPLKRVTCSRKPTHSSCLAWKILRTEEPGKLQSMESKRVRHDWTQTNKGPPYTQGDLI